MLSSAPQRDAEQSTEEKFHTGIDFVLLNSRCQIDRICVYLPLGTIKLKTARLPLSRIYSRIHHGTEVLARNLVKMDLAVLAYTPHTVGI